QSQYLRTNCLLFHLPTAPCQYFAVSRTRTQCEWIESSSTSDAVPSTSGSQSDGVSDI
ncbi:unnamed protein product, partial [Allacma fusca]